MKNFFFYLLFLQYYKLIYAEEYVRIYMQINGDDPKNLEKLRTDGCSIGHLFYSIKLCSLEGSSKTNNCSGFAYTKCEQQIAQLKIAQHLLNNIYLSITPVCTKYDKQLILKEYTGLNKNLSVYNVSRDNVVAIDLSADQAKVVTVHPTKTNEWPKYCGQFMVHLDNIPKELESEIFVIHTITRTGQKIFEMTGKKNDGISRVTLDNLLPLIGDIYFLPINKKGINREFHCPNPISEEFENLYIIRYNWIKKNFSCEINEWRKLSVEYFGEASTSIASNMEKKSIGHKYSLISAGIAHNFAASTPHESYITNDQWQLKTQLDQHILGSIGSKSINSRHFNEIENDMRNKEQQHLDQYQHKDSNTMQSNMSFNNSDILNEDDELIFANISPLDMNEYFPAVGIDTKRLGNYSEEKGKGRKRPAENDQIFDYGTKGEGNIADKVGWNYPMAFQPHNAAEKKSGHSTFEHHLAGFGYSYELNNKKPFLGQKQSNIDENDEHKGEQKTENQGEANVEGSARKGKHRRL